MFNDTILDHFQNPRNAGDLAAPAVTVETTNPVCGDILRLGVLVKDGRVAEIRFKARGCVAAIACGSAITELARGSTVGEAAGITAGRIASALGGLPPESGHAAELAEQALQAALRESTRP